MQQQRTSVIPDHTIVASHAIVSRVVDVDCASQVDELFQPRYVYPLQAEATQVCPSATQAAPQVVYPLRVKHAPNAAAQTPLLHVPLRHTCPQVPQLFGSVVVFVQVVVVPPVPGEPPPVAEVPPLPDAELPAVPPCAEALPPVVPPLGEPPVLVPSPQAVAARPTSPTIHALGVSVCFISINLSNDGDLGAEGAGGWRVDEPRSPHG